MTRRPPPPIDPKQWTVKGGNAPLSDDAVEAIARLCLERAERELAAKPAPAPPGNGKKKRRE